MMTKPNPKAYANFFSKLFFCWINELFSIGSKRRLEADDLYDLEEDDQSRQLSLRLYAAWCDEIKRASKKNRPPKLLFAIIRAFWRRYAALGIILFFEESAKIAQPLMIGSLLETLAQISTDESARTRAYLYATAVALCSVILAVVHHPYFFAAMRMGMWLRVSCCNLIYGKVLKLSQFSMLQTSTGQIVNLMTNDVQRLDYCCLFLHFFWLGPLEAIAVLVILWSRIGISALAGVAALIFLSPLQLWIGKLFASLRSKTAKLTDERVKLTSELIHGMRVVKMYCWEPMFQKLISSVRRRELIRVCHSFLANLPKVAHYMVYTKLAMLLVLLTAISQSHLGLATDPSTRITIANMFLCVTMFNAVRVALSIFMPYAVQFFAESCISLERIQKLLLLHELSINEQKITDGSDSSIEIREFSASWGHNEQADNVLSDISLSVTKPEIVGIIGPVGCGKSSLVMSILGELPACAGSMKVRGSVAYVAQQPWVFSATVRDNIIFGLPWDEDKYERAIEGSALVKDIEQWPDGDKTLVGERGVSLSGGQRARVGLARALYTNADIYLLDDPLSAVDSAVGKHLFNKCIKKLLHDKIRILVTHQLQYLKSMDRLIVLQNGSVFASGTYSDLVQKGLDLNMIIKTNEDSSTKSASCDKDDEPLLIHRNVEKAKRDRLTLPQIPTVSKIKQLKGDMIESSLSLDIDVSTSALSICEIDQCNEDESSNEDPMDEQRAEGTITWRVYVDYFLAVGNPFFLIFVLIIFALCQASYVLCDWWLALWMQWEEFRELNDTNNTLLSNETLTPVEFKSIPFINGIDSTISYFWIYCFLTASVLITAIIRSLVFYSFALVSSHRLHKNMLRRILHAPTRFFDVNSAGRILNRFSKDTGVMDEGLPPALSDFWITSFLVLGNLVVNFIISPWTIIAVVPLVICLLYLRKYYMKTSRDVKRIESITRSPVFAHVNNTLLGLTTIRASHSEKHFIHRFYELQDEHSRAWYIFLCTSRWLGIRLDWMCVCFVIVVCYISVITSNLITEAQAGLMITYAVGMLGMFQWCVRQSTEVENQMVSVERISEYTRLPQELPYESPNGQAPPPNWPESGTIEYAGVDFSYYDDGPTVLKSLSYQVKDREKIGIVGRTGAGKSSLVSSLLRLSEISNGKVLIDCINVGPPLGLHELRKRISIIPQDPVLFTGTVRWNLDPLGKQSDEVMWRALEDVQMLKPIQSMPNGLDAMIAEGGVNLSVGQRQLICLARALLGKNRILIIDEATANVDIRTDELIQETIRTKFAHCTVLTIAHRLHTIMDSDRIMVLDGGQLVEFDHPHLLLKHSDGYFYKMVSQLDSHEFVALSRVAEESYLAKQNASSIDDSIENNGKPIINGTDIKSYEITIDSASKLSNGDSSKAPIV